MGKPIGGSTPYEHRLFVYCTAAGEVEVLWNTTARKPPENIRHAGTGELAYLQIGEYEYAPMYLPAIGSRVFVPYTEVRRRVAAAAALDRRLQQHPNARAELEARYATREDAIEAMCAGSRAAGEREPLDDLTVTAGWLAGLQREREQQLQAGGWQPLPVEPDARPAVEIVDAPVNLGRASFCYDRQGRPITIQQWGELHGQEQYRTVARTTVRGCVVSTVWLGMDHGYDGRLLIFETLVFDARGEGTDCTRYETEAEALAGHEAEVAARRAAGATGGKGSN